MARMLEWEIVISHFPKDTVIDYEKVWWAPVSSGWKSGVEMEHSAIWDPSLGWEDKESSSTWPSYSVPVSGLGIAKWVGYLDAVLSHETKKSSDREADKP